MRRILVAVVVAVVAIVGPAHGRAAAADPSPVLLKGGLDIPPYQDIDAMARSGHLLYFNADDGVHSGELWATDGGDNTYMVKDINPGRGYGGPSSLTDRNGTVYFSADDGAHGFELWRSDGTDAGTTMVKDIEPGSGSGTFLPWMVNLNGALLFAANDGVHGNRLWRSDGTEPGTTMVQGDSPLAASGPEYLTVVDNAAYFYASGGLWKTDGTAAGTTLLSVHPNGINFLTKVGHRLFYVAYDQEGGTQLYVSDGTVPGTHQVTEFCPGPAGYVYGWSLKDLNGTAFFEANDCVHGAELWKSDGTAVGTTLVKDIIPGASSSYAFPVAALGNAMLFGANDGVHGYELWKTDGTDVGTAMVKDIDPGSASGALDTSGATVGTTTYFTADDGVHGEELWRTDGTTPGTALVADLNPGPDRSSPQMYTVVGDSLYFGAGYQPDGLNHPSQLWRIGKPIPAS